jgi:hypothetical protein
MPTKLSTTVSKIQTIPNTINASIIEEFHEYMKYNDSSERHQNNASLGVQSQYTLSCFLIGSRDITLAVCSFKSISTVYSKDIDIKLNLVVVVKQ